MSAPVWFDAKVYFNNKLAALGGGYNDLTLTAAFKGAGYGTDADSLYRHFLDYGNAENVSPSAYFDAGYYMQAKAASYFHKAVNAVTPAEISFVREAFARAGLSAWDHYLQYGMAEGVDPNANFDTSAYMDAKLAQMQASDPGYTMDMLVAAFKGAGLNPVTHYLTYGRGEGLAIQDAQHAVAAQALTEAKGDNLVGTTGTPTVDAKGDLTVNSVYDDLFTGEVNTLHSADVIDGLGGVDTLHARLNTQETMGPTEALEPTVRNVEYVLFQAQVAAGPGGGVPVQAYIDADRISLADGQTLTLGSVNSRANLSIEDVRHRSHETVIRFADADPAVAFDVFFDPLHLTSAAGGTSGTLDLRLMDVKNAQGSSQPLADQPFDKFTFEHVDGAVTTSVSLVFRDTDKGKYSGPTATYATLLEAFEHALADFEASHPALAGVFSVSLGAGFTGTASDGIITYTSNLGRIINLKSNHGSINADNPVTTGWGVSSGLVPATGGIVWGAAAAGSTECPLISTTVELDNVGRVKWDDASPDCLPDDIIYGSRAGDLEIGSMALRGGVERFDVKVDDGSWLSSLFSTNQTLRMVTVEARDIDGDGKSGGQLYIGDWAGRGDKLGDGANQTTWTDAARLLTASGLATPANPAGLNDVAVFDATDYAGAINIAAQITEASFDKYLKSVDGGRYIDKMYAPHGGYAGQFAYITGKGDDVVNMTVAGAMAADVDFKMNIDTGAGDDLVAFRYANMSVNQENDQKNLQNVTINTGAGNDTVWFYAPNAATPGGSVQINTGANNDVIYVNQEELFTGGTPGVPAAMPAPNAYNAVFVFNTTNRNLNNAAGFNGATLQNDLAVGMDTFAVTPTADEALYVRVMFKGYLAEAKIVDVTATTGSVTAEQINHAIIEAIANDPVLKHLISAKDGAGHTLLVESIINGQMTAADLGISFFAQKADGTPGATTVNTGLWYTTQFALNSAGALQYTGNNSTTSQAIVDGGAGNDLIALGPNGGRMDVIRLRGNFGDDTVVGFRTGEDEIDLEEYLDPKRALVTGVAANALVNNAAIVAMAFNAAATTGIFTQEEVDALVAANSLSLTGAKGDRAVAFLHDLNDEGQHVYTIVQMTTDGAVDKGTVMGSMTLDAINGVRSTIAERDFRLDSVIRDSLTGRTFGLADYAAAGATLDGTFFDDQFLDVSAVNMGVALLTIDAKEGNDRFAITGDIVGKTLNGGEGHDVFTFNSGAVNITGGTIDGGAGLDTLTTDATMTGNVSLTSLAAVESVRFNHAGTVSITAMSTDGSASSLSTSTAVTSLSITGLTANVATTIDASNVAGAVSVNAATSTASVNLVGTGNAAGNTLTGGSANDTISTSGTGVSAITGGAGDDVINLGSTGVDTVTFAATAAANGRDTITGFEAGAGKDVLSSTTFVAKGGALQSSDAALGDITVGGANTHGVLFNVAGGVLTADKVVAASTGANGEVVIGATQKAVVLVTAAATAATGGAYNMYYVTSDAANNHTVELVGTVTTDAVALDIGNFA